MMIPKEIVLSKCAGFSDIQIWPLNTYINPASWLTNFTKDELDFAVCLLNSFTYFSEPMVNRMLEAAFSNLLCKKFGYLGRGRQAGAAAFMDRMCITHVTGERPAPTDSGHIFSRKARQVLNIPEGKILYPEEAAKKICLAEVDHVIFVDDFVGSGDQFAATWLRPYIKGLDLSFSDFRTVNYYYIPIIATEYGLSRIQRDCPEVCVLPANVLPNRYSAFDEKSIIWPDELKSGVDDFFKSVEQRLGAGNAKGYAGLGFQIAFYHSVPDATLPIFWTNNKGWKPLCPRS